jgi:hypothetical protein
MPLPVLELGLFMSAVALLALYVLMASGHFPAEFRGTALRGRSGSLILWGTMIVAAAAGTATIGAAWLVLPWYAIVIGGGAMLLMAPLLLQALPDRVVDGRSGLLAFSAGASLVTAAIWLMAGAAVA